MAASSVTKENERLRALNSELVQVLRDVLFTCAPLSPRGVTAQVEAKALLKSIDQHKP